MEQFYNLFKSRSYYLARLLLVRLLIITAIFMGFLLLFFAEYNPGEDVLELTVFEPGLSKVITNSVTSFTIPLYLFLYLFSCILAVEYLYDPHEVKNFLSKGLNRYAQYLSISTLFVAYTTVLTVLTAVIYYKLYNELNSDFLFYFFILHILLLSQIKLLNTIGFHKNSILLVYFMFFMIFPLFNQSLMEGLLLFSDYMVLNRIVDFYFFITSIHIDLLSDIRQSFNGNVTADDLLNYIWYICGIEVFSLFLFSRKQFP